MSLTANITIQTKEPKCVIFGWCGIKPKNPERIHCPPIALLSVYGAIYFTKYNTTETYEMSFSSREYFDENFTITNTYEADLNLKLKEI